MLRSIVWLFLGLSTCLSHTAQALTDDLVENLDCRQVSESEVLRKLRRTTIDSAEFHTPWTNWSFSAGLYELANCWSLSRFQMLSTYLGHDSSPQSSVRETLNMIRLRFENQNPDAKPTATYSAPLTTFNWSSDYFQQLVQGVTDSQNGRSVIRNFKSEIEAYQVYRFHDLLRNWRYIWSGRERSTKENAKSLNQLSQNLAQNKMTLLLLRPHRLSQHVVMAKRFEKISSTVTRFWVYDSNSPRTEQSFYYRHDVQQFFAPDIVRGLAHVTDPYVPVGLFIVDEKERDSAVKKLAQHYKKRCTP